MRNRIAALAFACAAGHGAGQAVAADESVQPDLKQLRRDFFTLSYIKAVPNMMMKRCESEFPDELVQMRIGFMQWAAAHMEGDMEVARHHALLLKRLTEATKTPADELENNMNGLIEQRLINGLFKEFPREVVHELCMNLDKSLPRLMESARTELPDALRRLAGQAKGAN